jgi:hypothetical protein
LTSWKSTWSGDERDDYTRNDYCLGDPRLNRICSRVEINDERRGEILTRRCARGPGSVFWRGRPYGAIARTSGSVMNRVEADQGVMAKSITPLAHLRRQIGLNVHPQHLTLDKPLGVEGLGEVSYSFAHFALANVRAPNATIQNNRLQIFPRYCLIGEIRAPTSGVVGGWGLRLGPGSWGRTGPSFYTGADFKEVYQSILWFRTNVTLSPN